MHSEWFLDWLRLVRRTRCLNTSTLVYTGLLGQVFISSTFFPSRIVAVNVLYLGREFLYSRPNTGQCANSPAHSIEYQIKFVNTTLVPLSLTPPSQPQDQFMVAPRFESNWMEWELPRLLILSMPLRVHIPCPDITERQRQPRAGEASSHQLSVHASPKKDPSHCAPLRVSHPTPSSSDPVEPCSSRWPRWSRECVEERRHEFRTPLLPRSQLSINQLLLTLATLSPASSSSSLAQIYFLVHGVVQGEMM